MQTIIRTRDRLMRFKANWIFFILFSMKSHKPTIQKPGKRGSILFIFYGVISSWLVSVNSSLPQ